MKWGLLVGLLAVPLVLVILSDEASATTVCQGGTGPANANVCQGYSHVSTPNGALGARCFAFRTVNTAPTCVTATGITPSNDPWELLPGACTTLYYFDTTSGAPPSAPNKLTLLVSLDNTNTNVIVFLNLGAEPANGTPYTFCATSDGTAGGAARAGTYKVVVRAVKDNAPGGVGNYDVNSNGNGLTRDNGALRSNVQVASVARSAYPAGSTFAYGAAGDETITITATFTQPNVDAGVESGRTFISDTAATTTYQLGATVDLDSTSLAQGFVADTTFPVTTADHYGQGIQFSGNSVLTGSRWTEVAASGHGAGLSVAAVANTVLDTTGFSIDSRIRMDTDGSGFATADETDSSYVGTCGSGLIELFNLGETMCHSWYVVNARSEQLTRTMTIEVRSGASQCTNHGSVAPTAGLYSVTFALPTGGSCAAAADLVGTTRFVRVSNTDQLYNSGTVFSVSSLLLPEVHLDSITPRTGTEVLEFFIREGGGGVDDSDTIHLSCFVAGVRGTAYDTSGSAIAASIRDPTATIRASGTADSDADGWTPIDLDLLASTPLGTTWDGRCIVTHNGNSGTDTDVFTVGVEGGGGETVYTGADPLTVFCLYDAGTDLVHCAVSSRFLDGSARLGAEDDIFVDFYDADHTLIEDDYPVVEQSDQDGAYYATWTPPDDGLYEAVAHTLDPVSGDPVGAHNVVEVQSQELLAMSFNTLEFDGFLFLLFWGSVLLYCLARSRVFAGFTATLGLLETVMPDVMPGSFLGYFFLLIIAVWLEAIAGEKIYGKWLNKGKGDTEDT